MALSLNRWGSLIDFANYSLAELRDLRRSGVLGAVGRDRLHAEIQRREKERRKKGDPQTMVRIALPWTQLASKNVLRPGEKRKDGEKRFRETVRGARDYIAREIRHLGDPPIFVDHVWAHVRFFAPDDRPDCHNFIDALADSLEGPVVINDRKIRRWLVQADPEDRDPTAPMAIVAVGPAEIMREAYLDVLYLPDDG